MSPSPTDQVRQSRSSCPPSVLENTTLFLRSTQNPNDTRAILAVTPQNTSIPSPVFTFGLQQFEWPIIPDLLNLFILLEKLDLPVLEERRVPDPIPESRSIIPVISPSLGTHPAACIAERGEKLAHDKVIGFGTRCVVSTNIGNVGGSKRFRTFGVTGNEAHPPTVSTPRSSMTCSEEQICADENTGASPERTSVIVIFSDPDFADGAVRPDFRTGVDIALKKLFDGIIVLGLEFAANLLALGLVSVFRNVGFSDGDLSAGEMTRLVTLGDFEAGFLHVAFDFDWIETALGLAALRWGAGRTVFRLGALRLVNFRFIGWLVLGCIFGFILAGLGLVFRVAIFAGFGFGGSVFWGVFGFVLARFWLGGVFWIVVGSFAGLVVMRFRCVVGGLGNGVRSDLWRTGVRNDLWRTGGRISRCVFAGASVCGSHRRSMC